MNVNPIDDYSVATDLSGVLDVLVRQPVDNSPSEDSRGIHYTEKWKGPYAKLKEILSKIRIGQTLTEAHVYLQTFIGLSEQIPCPQLPITRDGNVITFKVAGIKVEEIAAGAHGILTLDFDGIPRDDAAQWITDPYQDVWSVSWQSYSVDPYAFVSNKANDQYPVAPNFDMYPEKGIPPDDVYLQSAMRQHIDMCLNTKYETKKVKNENYTYYSPDQTQPEQKFFLNFAEQAVMNKKLLGRSATYHYPVVVHQTVQKGDFNAAATYGETIGQDLDYEVTLLNCPYEFDAVWKFIKIGDDMTQTTDKKANTTTFTRKETFMGVTNYDKNFYGSRPFSHTKEGILSGRWELEAL